MKKTLIVTNIITFLLLVLVIVYAQWQGGNARKAYESKVEEVAECQRTAEEAQRAAQLQVEMARQQLLAADQNSTQ